jgi:hypothetical protein
MGMIITENSTTELWVKLVQNAGQTCQQELDVELESYLVFMLMRHVDDTGLADAVLAPRYLQGMQTQGQSGIQQLQTVADQCLLFSGLFPKRSRRRLVKAHFYVDLGRSAYMQLASRVKQVSADLYENLSRHFVEMMDILQALRFSENSAELDSLLLLDYWQDCDSQYARRLLQERYGHALQPLREKGKN